MTGLQKIKPTRPAAPYLGGKRILASRIIELINTIPHKSYVEPFCGMGGVFFRRDSKPVCEVINDLNGEVANFFRVLQRHGDHLCEMLKFGVTCRQEFNRLKQCDPATLTDLERAYRFTYLQKTAFGGKVTGQAFGVQPGSGPRLNSIKLNHVLSKLHERLSGVVVENLTYADCIRRYDKSDTLFYLDPPYWDTENSYGSGMFAKEDFQLIAKILAGIKGAFILSINDTPEIRKIFSQFRFFEVELSYTISRKAAKRSRELIFTNAG